MSLSLRLAALLVSFGATVNALSPGLPAVTNAAMELPDVLNGLSPVPTAAPNRFELGRMLKRQASIETCAFLDGSSAFAYTCDPGYCGYFTSQEWFGCCSSVTTDAAGSRRFFPSYCPILTSCVPFSSMAACTGACASDSQVLRCSKSATPYCANVAMRVAGQDYTHPLCFTTPYTVSAAFPTGLYATSSRPVSITRSSSSASLVINSISSSSSSSASGSLVSQTQSATPAPSGPPAGAIAGGVVGGVALIAAVVLGVIFFLRKKKKTEGAPEMTNAGAVAPPPGGVNEAYKPPLSPPPPAVVGGGAFGYPPQQQQMYPQAAPGAPYYGQPQPGQPQVYGQPYPPPGPPKQDYYSQPTATSPTLPPYQQQQAQSPTGVGPAPIQGFAPVHPPPPQQVPQPPPPARMELE